MVRESVNEPWRTVSWDTAIDFAAQRLNGPGALWSPVHWGNYIESVHQ